MQFDLTVNSPFDTSLATGTLKSRPEDFRVEERMRPEFTQSGEHVWLWLEKTGQNTEYVAKQLARAYGVREMDVGYAGLKDRHAVTRQWFSIYLGNRAEVDWRSIAIDGVQVLAAHRHARKLRRGEHQGNHFNILLRDFSARPAFFQILERVREDGFPNYFGAQRFGRQGLNLQRALAMFERRIKVSRAQHSIYLSAVRSWLFNQNLCRQVVAGSWHTGAGPLYGDAAPGVADLEPQEQALLETYPEFARGIHQNRMTLMRRLYRVQPESMSWVHEGAMLRLEFFLPPGAFATTLLTQCMQVSDVTEMRTSAGSLQA
jgi:tRNA pseudouridine13 synthase